MREDSIAKIAALYAKEITVAKANSSDVSPCEASGKHMANFYTELFKGINEALQTQLSKTNKTLATSGRTATSAIEVASPFATLTTNSDKAFITLSLSSFFIFSPLFDILLYFRYRR